MRESNPDLQVNEVNYINNIIGVRHCFVCDSYVSGKGTPLLMSIAPYSKVSLPTKIGQLLGDSFMVIVAADDVLCRRCSMLIIRLDKLETDTELVKKSLTGYLKMKYNLYDEEETINCQFVEETGNDVFVSIMIALR